MRIAGYDKNISDEPISLTIFSPHVVDLTMVDLPGITKVPIKGQPHDIEDQIKRITYKYISQPNALILALTAANTDLANSDALKMAREVDPDGERTIGVVTKIDLMDQGTDALDLLQGKIYPLNLGYYGVKCRSQRQIDENITIREALENETKFFATHPTYSSYCDRLGIPYLADSLNKILCQHIIKCIPSLSRQINELLQNKEIEIVQLDINSYSIEGDKGPVVLNLINRFTNSYGEMIEGKFVKESAIECLGGSRINYIFHSIFVKSIKEIDPF
jgi:dynamin 1-like protein